MPAPGTPEKPYAELVVDYQRVERQRDSLARRCAVRFEEAEALRGEVAQLREADTELRQIVQVARSHADWCAAPGLRAALERCGRGFRGSGEIPEHTCGDPEDTSAAVRILRAAADAIEDAPGWGDSEAARLREIAQVMEEEAGDEEQSIATAMLTAARGY